jgi:hypothetical protein
LRPPRDRRALLALGDADYPALLRKIDAPPPDAADARAGERRNRAAVAIVGSRNASAVGLAITERVAQRIGAGRLCRRLGAGARRRRARPSGDARDRNHRRARRRP